LISPWGGFGWGVVRRKEAYAEGLKSWVHRSNSKSKSKRRFPSGMTSKKGNGNNKNKQRLDSWLKGSGGVRVRAWWQVLRLRSASLRMTNLGLV